MFPWEDDTLLQLIVYAQQNPDCDLGPLRDRIMEGQYRTNDMAFLGSENPFPYALVKHGYQYDTPRQWSEMRIQMGFSCGGENKIAIPFPETE